MAWRVSGAVGWDRGPGSNEKERGRRRRSIMFNKTKTHLAFKKKMQERRIVKGPARPTRNPSR